MCSQAIANAQEYFSVLRARLAARAEMELEGVHQVVESRQDQEALRTLVLAVLGEPTLAIDVMGAYVLSEAPICRE